MMRAGLVVALFIASCAHETPVVSSPVAQMDPADLYLAQQLAQDSTLFDADRHSLLERVTRDYNNDGRPDVALSLLDSCGAGSYSTGCDHDFYVARVDGGYDFAGYIPAHAEGETLTAIAPGAARLTQCIYRREPPDSLDTYIVTEHGVAGETSSAMSEAQLDAACPSGPDAFPMTLELCDVSDYGRTHHCAWRREGE